MLSSKGKNTLCTHLPGRLSLSPGWQ
ncbi:hypothetical protein CIB84_014239 [Bambusicola thoracicus]|uniref:Uncharacterized protein n=1 Tax=Bambusicola thoracicus TaxID=9083 RepID=A0A2P4SD26_BAMTH|nr:hypothetical protein CIB84_014239 [Bambusicola thoracicus]